MAISNRAALSAVAMTALISSMALFAPAASAEMVLNRNIGTTISSLDPQINFLVYEGWIEEDLYEGLTAGARLPATAATTPDFADRCFEHYANTWPIAQWLLAEVAD